MAGNLKVQIVGEQGVKLDAQQTALGHAAAPLLHDEAEILLQRRVHDHHGLAEQGSPLGAADIAPVAQAGDLRYGQLRAVGHDAVAQPGPVDEQRQAVFPAGVVQSRQLRLGIQGAALGGVGDIHHAGLDNVLGGLVVPVPLHIILHLLGGDLPLCRRQGDDLVAGGLDGPRLVAVDVSAVGGQHALPGPQNGGDHGGVGLGAAHQEVNVSLRRLADGADLLPGRRAVLVLAVAHGLHHIGLVEPRHHAGMSALQIVAVEIDHGSFSFILYTFSIISQWGAFVKRYSYLNPFTCTQARTWSTNRWVELDRAFSSLTPMAMRR